jgi:hypothetical protein
MSEPENPATVTDTSNLALLHPAESEAAEKSFARQCIGYAWCELWKHPQVQLIAEISAPVIVGLPLGFIAGTKWSNLLAGLGVGALSALLTLVVVWIIIFLYHLKHAPATLFKQKQDEISALRSLVTELRKANEVKTDNATVLKNLIALHSQGTLLFQTLKNGGSPQQGQVVEWYNRTYDYLNQAKGPSYATEFTTTIDMLPPDQTCTAANRKLCAALFPRLTLLMEFIRAMRDKST